MLALVEGERLTATPGTSGICPTCGSDVTAKCGRVNVWHWAHRAMVDCDPWAEPMTYWHAKWQSLFPIHTREVPLGKHRADVRLDSGTVVEFQHSSLSVDDIRQRETFYGPSMLWVFDATEAADSGRLELRRKSGREPDYRTFRWKQPRRSVLQCRRPVFLDVGKERLLKLDFMGKSAPYGGCGRLIAAEQFVSVLNPAGGE